MPAAGFWSGGERLRAAHVLAAARFEWKLVWRRRRFRGALLLALVCVVLSAGFAALKLQGRIMVLGSDALAQLVVVWYLQILLVLVALLVGTSLVAQDAEARTLTYLLARPLSRGSLLVGKFLGSWAAASVALCLSLALSALLLLAPDGFDGGGVWVVGLPQCMLLLAAGALAYGALFTLVGLLFARPALVGLFLAFAWEGAVPWLPGWIKSLTVRHHLAAFLPDPIRSSSLLAAYSPPAPHVAALWLLGGAALSLGASVWWFARRDYP